MLLFTEQNLIHPFPYIITQLSSFPTQRLLWLPLGTLKITAAVDVFGVSTVQHYERGKDTCN